MKLISFLCLATGIFCGWYNYTSGHDLVLIPAGIAVFVGLFCGIREVKVRNGDVLAWFLVVGNGLLALITILISVGVALSALM